MGEIRRYLRDNNIVRVSRAMRDTAYKALAVKERLTSEKSREPSADEIAKELGVSKEDVVLALESIVDPVSLFEPVYSEGSDAIYVMDQVSDGGSDNNWLDEILIKRDDSKSARKRARDNSAEISGRKNPNGGGAGGGHISGTGQPT